MQNKPEKCVYLHMTISRCPGSVVKGASGVAGTQTLVSGGGLGGLGGLGGGLGSSTNNTVAGAVDQRGAQVSGVPAPCAPCVYFLPVSARKKCFGATCFPDTYLFCRSVTRPQKAYCESCL